MSAMFLGLRTVIYHVVDLSAAKQWYARAFGVEPYFDQPFYVGFNIEGFELGLDPDASGVTAGNNAVAYWGVVDIERAHQHMLECGAKPVDPVTEVGGDIKVAAIADPFGNII